MLRWSVVVSVFRDEPVLEANLSRSPALRDAAEVIVKRGVGSVAAAYNQALREASTDVAVFVHPDVYLPETFHASLAEAIAWLERNDPSWAVLGLVGSTADGAIAGFTYSVGLGSFVGKPLDRPTRVRTVDEFVFVVRKSSGIAFDEQLPGAQSQLGAADICLDAEGRGQGVYVIPAFVLHNSNGWRYMPLRFWKPYLYIRRKWRRALPVYVPYARITRFCMPMIRNTIKALRPGASGHRECSRVDDVVALHSQLCGSMAGLLALERRNPDPAQLRVGPG